jgi:ABC-type antimicrobial peptide transport system permease subunit
MIRTTGEAMSANTLVRNRIEEIDPNLFVHDIRPLDEQLDRALLPFRILTYIVAIPGAFALLLGIIGIYGTMAILVSQRRREIGIRIALGAVPSGATRLIIREGLRSASIGIALGLSGAFAIALWLSRNISEFNFFFFDPGAFVGMTLVILTTALIACYIPARRASRVDPMLVLREE